MNKMVLVSNDEGSLEKVRSFAQSLGVSCETSSEVVLPTQANTTNVLAFPEPTKASGQTMAQVEAQAITKAITDSRGNLTEAAKALGIGRATLYRKVKEYNVDTKSVRVRKSA